MGPITDERNGHVTFNKRKSGLIKKAMELSILCNCQISLVIFNAENQLFEYCSTDPRYILQRYCQVAHLPHERLTNADYDKNQKTKSKTSTSTPAPSAASSTSTNVPATNVASLPNNATPSKAATKKKKNSISGGSTVPTAGAAIPKTEPVENMYPQQPMQQLQHQMQSQNPDLLLSNTFGPSSIETPKTFFASDMPFTPTPLTPNTNAVIESILSNARNQPVNQMNQQMSSQMSHDPSRMQFSNQLPQLSSNNSDM